MIHNWLIPPHVQYLIRGFGGRVPSAHYKRFLREIVAWSIPSEIQSLVLSTYYKLTGRGISGTEGLRGRHAGERRCFVIGNGPSLADTDLRPLADEVVIAHNSFYKHPHASEASPQYVCIADESFFVDEPKTVEWHRVIERKLPDVELMLNLCARTLIQKYGLYRQHACYYYQHGVTVHHPDLVHFDFMKPRNVGHTAGTRLGIPLAIYLGFEEIVLLGFDANWLDDYQGSYHFYDAHQQWPEFDSLAADYRQPRYEDQLIFAQRDYHSHYLLSQAAPRAGVSIVNATKGGHLDMYPRVRYESLLGGERSGRSIRNLQA